MPKSKSDQGTEEGLRLDAFCLQDFWAMEAAFRFIRVAYNLMRLFRHFGLNAKTKPHW